MNGSCKNVNRTRSLLLSLLAVVVMLLLSAAVFYICISGAFTRSTSDGVDNRSIKLIIDEDGGADDAMAISMALLSEKYYKGPTVIALTTVHGNVLENQTFINSQKILDANGRREVKIYRGATQALLKGSESDYYFGVDGLGDVSNATYKPIEAQDEVAANAMIRYSKKYPGQLTILTLGSLTNIALAIRLDPNFLGRLAQLYVAAGHIQDAKYVEAEFNIVMDPEAYKIVTDTATVDKVTVVPFSAVMESLNITNDWRINTLGAIQTQLMRTINQWEKKALEKTSYWSMLDPSAMGIILDENMLIETRYSKNDIELEGDKRGLITNDFTAVDNYNVKVATKMDVEIYKQLLYSLFSAEITCKLSK